MKNQKVITACIILIFVALAVADTLSNFVEQSDPFNITFIGNENQTFFLELPIYTKVQNITLLLSSLERFELISNNGSICNQDNNSYKMFDAVNISMNGTIVDRDGTEFLTIQALPEQWTRFSGACGEAPALTMTNYTFSAFPDQPYKFNSLAVATGFGPSCHGLRIDTTKGVNQFGTWELKMWFNQTTCDTGDFMMMGGGNGPNAWQFGMESESGDDCNNLSFSDDGGVTFQRFQDKTLDGWNNFTVIYNTSGIYAFGNYNENISSDPGGTFNSILFLNFRTQPTTGYAQYFFRDVMIYDNNTPCPSTNGTIINPYLQVGEGDETFEWSFTGRLENPIDTSLNISVFNNILTSDCNCQNCSKQGTQCRIPFTFHSDTAGTLNVEIQNATHFTNLTINIFDRETETLILQNVEVVIAGEDNYSTTTGTINVPDFSTLPGPYTAYASSSGYVTGQKAFLLTDSNSTIIDIYLINSTSPNVGNLIVNIFDEFFNLIVGANVKLLEYKPGIDSFVEVEQCFSNTNGECIFGVELNTKFYIVQATANLSGVDYFGQSTDRGELIKIDNTLIDIHMTRADTFTGPSDFDFIIIPTNTSLVGNISFLTATFNDPNNNEHTVCIEYYFRRGTNDISLASPTCVTATAGIVNAAGGFILDPSITNVAKIYVTDGGGFALYAEYVYAGDDSFSAKFGGFVKYIVLGLWLALLTLAIWLKNMGIFGAGSIILSLSIPWFQPNLIGATTTVFIILLSIIIIAMANKRTQ